MTDLWWPYEVPLHGFSRDKVSRYCLCIAASVFLCGLIWELTFLSFWTLMWSGSPGYLEQFNLQYIIRNVNFPYEAVFRTIQIIYVKCFEPQNAVVNLVVTTSFLHISSRDNSETVPGIGEILGFVCTLGNIRVLCNKVTVPGLITYFNTKLKTIEAAEKPN